MLEVLIPYIDSFFTEFTEKLGLADMITETGNDATKRFPGILVAKGEMKQIDLDRVVSYHRLRGTKTIESTDGNTMGCSKGIRLTYPMYFIGSLKNDCQYSNDTISNNLANVISKITFPKPVKRQLKAWAVEVVVTDINQSQPDVFEQEYTNIGLNIDYSLAYFCISYNIIIDADSSCLSSQCDPLPVNPVCYPAAITLNGESFLVVNSGATQNILLVDQSDNPIVPESVVDNKIVIDVDCEDATAVLKNTEGAEISTTEIASGGTEDITAPDGTYVLKNTDGTTLGSGGIPSNESEDITAPDSTLLLNSEAFLLAASGSETDILLVNQDDIPIIPQSVVGPKITITEDRSINLRFIFVNNGDDITGLLTISSFEAGTYTTISSDGSSGTITVSVNGGAYAVFSSPLVLEIGGTIQFKRTTTGATGYVQIGGEYES